MKITICLLLTTMLLTVARKGMSQASITWHWSARSIQPGVYELSFEASMTEGWHIYSPQSPPGAGLPTAIAYTRHPLVKLAGKLLEQGELLTRYERVYDVNIKYYERRVRFVQRIRVPAGITTEVSGTITYMVCNAVRCLAPATTPFSITVGGE